MLVAAPIFMVAFLIIGVESRTSKYGNPDMKDVRYVLECGAGTLGGLCYGYCRCSISGHVECPYFDIPGYPECNSQVSCIERPNPVCPVAMCQCTALEPFGVIGDELDQIILG